MLGPGLRHSAGPGAIIGSLVALVLSFVRFEPSKTRPRARVSRFVAAGRAALLTSTLAGVSAWGVRRDGPAPSAGTPLTDGDRRSIFAAAWHGVMPSVASSAEVLA